MALSLRASMDIGAPARQVFEIICTPERLPEWNVSVEAAHRAEAGVPVGLGARAVFRGKLLGQSLEGETEVVKYEPPRVFATRAIRGPRLLTEFGLESQPHGTRVQLDVTGEVPGGKIGQMMAEGFLRRELSASLERLRQICEREAQARAAGEALDGGDPACWLQLGADEARGN